MSVCSCGGMRSLSFIASGESKRQSSTFVACAENSAKFTPTPVQVAPSGYGSPGQMRTKIDEVHLLCHRAGTGDSGLGAGLRFGFEAIDEVDDRGAIELA